MEKCVHCGAELIGGQRFCSQCGERAEAGAETTSPPASPREEKAAEAALKGVDIPLPEVGAGKEAAQRYIEVGRETHIGKIEIKEEKGGYCPYCGRAVSAERSYQCPKCGQFPLCWEHYNIEQRACALCTPQAFYEQCPRCKERVDKGRWNTRWGMCQKCSESYESVVDKIGKGEVVVGRGGEVLSHEETGTLKATREGLVTGEGEQVATLKPQVWYRRGRPIPIRRPHTWYETRPSRLEQEVKAMKSFYPQMELGTAPDGKKYWEGVLSTWKGNNYHIRITYPDFFPYQPIRANILEPKIPKSRHIYENGDLCLFHKDDQAWDVNTTARVVVSWVAKWLHAYEVWLQTGEWPGPERDQDVIEVRA